MMVLHLMGHVHLSLEGRRLDLSSKGLALMSYLTLERRPQHREHIASLLWENVEARQNLRVELTKLRSAGLDVFPSSARLLELEGMVTDLEQWEQLGEQDLPERALGEWLGYLRGLPLSGLEDLGTSEFREWVYHQASALLERIAATLEARYLRYHQQGQPAACALIRVRAERLGLELPPLAPISAGHPSAPPSGAGLHFERPKLEALLLTALEQARKQPRMVLLRGAAGVGKTYLADWLAARSGWLCLRVGSLHSSRLTLATLISQLSRLLGGTLGASLHHLLVHPSGLEEDMVRFLGVLGSLEQPVMMVLEQAETAPAEGVSLLEFLLSNLPRGLLLLTSREEEGHSALARVLRRRLSPETCLDLQVLPPTLSSVCRALARRAPELGEDAHLGYASQLLQRSDGNVQHLLALLEGDVQALREAPLPAAVQEVYLSETEAWPPALLEALRCLSVVHLPFDEDLACALLSRMNLLPPRALLVAALERGVLHPCAPERTLAYPFWTPISDDLPVEEHFEFRHEAMRIALASTLPHPARQELRRHLMHLLEEQDPGLAAYYAHRTRRFSDHARLFERHRQRLPSDSPLRLGLPATQALLEHPVVAPPQRNPLELPSVRELGYTLALEQGWLCLRRRGRYGHAETLRVLFSLPEGAGRGVLRLIWRLDAFNGGYDMLPSKVPYALRLRTLSSAQAHLLSPEALTPYLEEGLEHLPLQSVSEGGWMEQQLVLEGRVAGEMLELSVRALDVALIVGALEWNGVSLLEFAPPRRALR